MAIDTTVTNLSERHRDDLDALLTLLPHVSGVLKFVYEEHPTWHSVDELADAVAESCELLIDMGAMCTGAPPEAAVTYLTYRGRLRAAIRRCYRRADGQVTA